MKTEEDPSAVLLLWHEGPQQCVAQPSPFLCHPRLFTKTFPEPWMLFLGGKQE